MFDRKSGIEMYKEKIKEKNCFTCEHSKSLQFSEKTNKVNIYFTGLTNVKVHCEFKGKKDALSYCPLYDSKMEVLDISEERIEYKK